MRGKAPSVRPVRPSNKKSTVKPVSAGSNNGAAPRASQSPKTTSSVKFIPTCSDCGINIDDSVRALQCDRCCDDSSWKCGECLGLSVEVYESLLSNSACELRWFCDPCNKLIMVDRDGISDKLDVISKTMERLVDRIQSIETMNEKNNDMEQKLMDKVHLIEQSLLNKAENDLLQKVDGRLRKIEDNPAVIEDIQLRLENKMDLLRNNIDEPVALAVQGAIQEDKAEEMEIERRKKNVIVHGVPESVAEPADDRINDDLSVLAAMFQEVKVDNIRVDSVVRLGKKASDPVQNPRPMKLVLNSEESKISLLKNAKNLREKQEGGWSKVFIHQDLTPKQREARKPLVAELKDRRARGEQNLIIFNRKVVKRKGSQPSPAN